MIETGKIINGDCIEVMKTLPEGSVDLVVTSPPYNCGINYDTHIDTLPMDDYWGWTKEWLEEAYRLLKDDGRVSINIPYETNVQGRGGRVFFVSEFYQQNSESGIRWNDPYSDLRRGHRSLRPHRRHHPHLLKNESVHRRRAFALISSSLHSQ
jgi:DNA modification methylase